MRKLRWRASALLAVNLALLALLAALAVGQPQPVPGVLLACGAAALSALAILAMVWRLTRKLERQLQDGDAAAQRQREILDALGIGLALFDGDDRLALCNHDFRVLYESLGLAVVPGRRFEEMLRDAVAQGAVPAAAADPEAFVAARLAAHRAPGAPLLRQLPDGRWRRIVEQRLADGSLLAHSVDVTELVQNEQALAQARADAELAHRRLVDAIEALPAGFELYDGRDRLLLANRRMAEMYPRVADLITQRPSFETLVRSNFERGGLPALAGEGVFEPWLAGRLAQRRNPGEPALHKLADGRWVRTYERLTHDGGIVGVRIDVTELQQQKAAAEQASMRLQDAIDALPDAFALYDADDRLVVFNQRYLQIYGASAEAIQPGATFEAILRRGLAQGQYPQALGCEDAWLADRLERHRNPDGRAFLQELPGNRWLWTDERRTRDGGVAGVRTEVTEIVRREQELRQLNARLDALNLELAQLSDTDALTGLANRRQFDRRLATEWARARRHHMPLSLLLLDVDHFKRFNDRHGHPAGDACLRQVAALLAAAARRPTDLVARIGGEEFAILLPHQDGDAAALLAQHCLQALDQAALEHGDSPVAAHVTLSVGVADAARLPDGEAPTLLAAADAALYRAKQSGRHRSARAV